MFALDTPAHPSILIVNVHSSRNAGDLALLECTIEILKKTFDAPYIVVAANWPDEPALKDLGVEIIPSAWHVSGVGQGIRPRWQMLAFLQGVFWAFCFRVIRSQSLLDWLVPQKWKMVLSIYPRIDLVVAVSGNQFFSSGRYGWPLPTIAFSVWLAHLFRKPLYIFPQSIGPFVRGFDRWLLLHTYRDARRIYLRDMVSMHLAEELGLPPGIVKFMPDPAFNYPPASRQQALEILVRHGFIPGQPALGITLLAPMPSYLDQDQMNRYYAAMAKTLLRMTAENKVQIYIFIQVSGPIEQENDRNGVEAVLKLIGRLPASIHFVDEELAPQTLKACYGLMDLFIASRLHSGIFAMGMHVPTLCIGYLTKTRGVLEAVGLEENMLELKQVDEALLWKKLSSLWENRQAASEKLKVILPALSSSLEKMEDEIANDYIQSVST